MRFLSIILGNEELFSILNTNFPPEFTEDNFEIYLNYAECCYHFSQFSPDFDFSNIINNISSNFYSVDQNEFLKLSRRIQYMILSNPNLQIKSEDSLLDLVLQIIEKEEKDGEEIDNISFLEQIEFTGLSESKLRSFLSYFDINQLTNSLWQKLFQCFFIHFDKKMNRIEKNSHFIKRTVIDYDEYKTDRFGGIIHHLTEQCGGNVDSNGICKITSSSVFNNFKAPNVADFSSNIHFCSMFDVNSWLMIDFKERKVHPTFYSIRSYRGKEGYNLKSWVVEGSNTGNSNDWMILDSRENNSTLNSPLITKTFKIQNEIIAE